MNQPSATLATESANTDTDPSMTQPKVTLATESAKVNTVHGVAAADWDAPSLWRISYPDGCKQNLTREEFLRCEFSKRFDVLVVEAAHLKERNELSVAQVYSKDELNNWRPYFEVKLFPAKSTPKALEKVGLQKNKDDAEAIRFLVRSRPDIFVSLKPFVAPKNNQKKINSHMHRTAIREDIARTYNIFRAKLKTMTCDEARDMPEIVRCRARVESFYDSLSEEMCEQFNIRYMKKGPRKGLLLFESPTQMMSAYYTVFDKDDKLRVRPDGKFVGIRYLRDDVIGLSHSHQPNLMRSNLIFWGMRTSKLSKQQFTRNFTKMLQLLRDSSYRPTQPRSTLAIESANYDTGRFVG